MPSIGRQDVRLPIFMNLPKESPDVLECNAFVTSVRNGTGAKTVKITLEVFEQDFDEGQKALGMYLRSVAVKLIVLPEY